MKRVVIGYIFTGRFLGRDEKLIKKLAKKERIEVVLINAAESWGEEEIKEKISKCDIVYNATAEEFSIEFEKTIEELGKRVLDPSKLYYHIEDKWIFFVKCKENNIPTPESILLLSDLNSVKKKLVEFNRWPIVLKRVYGCMGEYVEKAENLESAKKIIKKFWKKGNERIPIIAQELIKSPSYRVTVIGDKIIQTAIKKSNSWKATGNYARNFKRFEVDDELKKLIKKLLRVVKINICGIDLLKKDGKWIVLEVNSSPGFDFFEKDRENLNLELLKCLKQKSKNFKN